MGEFDPYDKILTVLITTKLQVTPLDKDCVDGITKDGSRINWSDTFIQLSHLHIRLQMTDEIALDLGDYSSSFLLKNITLV